jgi:hypothetical protein
MALQREETPKEDGESDDEYRQRLYVLAHPAFEAYMARQHVWYVAEQERRARRDAELDAKARAALRQVHSQTVRQELNSSSQTKLRKAKQRYAS